MNFDNLEFVTIPTYQLTYRDLNTPDHKKVLVDVPEFQMSTVYHRFPPKCTTLTAQLDFLTEVESQHPYAVMTRHQFYAWLIPGLVADVTPLSDGLVQISGVTLDPNSWAFTSPRDTIDGLRIDYTCPEGLLPQGKPTASGFFIVKNTPMKLKPTEQLHWEDVKILGQLVPGGKNTRQQLAAKTRLPQHVVNQGLVTLLNNGLIREEYGKPCRYAIDSTANDLKRVIEEQKGC